MSTPELYIGLMSGTSLDGVDGVLACWPDETGPSKPRVLAHRHLALGDDLRAELLALNTAGHNELHRAALAASALMRVCHQVVADLLASQANAVSVTAIGLHGQTVRHQPGLFDGTGYTLQLHNAALLAELGGIDVICDFRSRDVAAGGQGAPLVPAFHAHCFHRAGETIGILNLGGIANLTVLHADGRVGGFDCGPANALLDLWCLAHTGRAFDDGGDWGASGQVQSALLSDCLSEPFFSAPPPKSTGRDLFNSAWLDAQLQASPGLRPQDIQATLAEVTARSAAEALLACAPDATALWVCGGGAHNRLIMQRLQAHLPSVAVAASDQAGLPVDQVEACAFAWLARAFIHRQPGALPQVTGARGGRILGALYPAQ